MEDVKKNISDNLTRLRKAKKLTQQDLAKVVNYSDKAISRWEVGDSLPDIVVLLQLCDYYNVSFEWLIKEHSDGEEVPLRNKQASQRLSLRISIACLIVISIYAIATVFYVYSLIIKQISIWQLFIWSVPVCSVSLIVFGRKIWNELTQVIISSVGIWSLLTSIYCHFIPNNLWALFLLGVPIQIILILAYFIKKIKD